MRWWIGRSPAKEQAYYKKMLDMFGVGNTRMAFVKRESIRNQFYSDLVTPIKNGISVPGTTVHIFYAVKMGKQYLERYKKHFKAPDIRRHDLQHEELLVCYPQQWAEEVRNCCRIFPKSSKGEEENLQQCGFKLSTILSDIFGMSGTLLVKRLCEKGALEERDVVECLKGTLRGKVSEVRLAVAGKLSEHDRIFLTNLVKVKENCDREIEDVEQRITEYSEKYEPAMQALETIPAVQRRASAIIISELGVDLSMFQSAGHLCKWAGLCPGDNESAKKKKTMRITKGNPRIKSVMCQCAWAATRCKKFFLRDWFYRLRARRGTKKALIAVARKLLAIVWHVLTTGEAYDEARYEQTKKNEEERRKQKLKAEAAKLGFKLMPV